MANSKDNINKYATSFIGFDEMSGNVYDSIGGYTGTIYNAPTRVESWSGQGHAMSFNGINQYLIFNKNIMPKGALTLKFKIRKKSDRTNQVIMTTTRGDYDTGIQIGVNGQGGIYLSKASGNSTSSGIWNDWHVYNPNPLIKNKWYKIAVTWDGTISGKVHLYVDDMINPVMSSTPTRAINETHTFDLSIGRGHDSNIYSYSDVDLDDIELYDKVVSIAPDKHLILHNNQYKYHDGTSWQVKTATETNFIQFGHDDLSHITEAQWAELAGEKSIAVWSDFEDKQYVSAVLEKEPFTAKDIIGNDAELITYTTSATDQLVINTETDDYSVYEHISETPTAIIYTESTDDITITTTTVPYTLYDEFGDEVEILYYTDDEVVTEADLVIEANWSPLDELKGEVEVVTWTDEDASTAKRELEIEGLHESAIVKQLNPIPVSNMTGIQMINSAAPFVLQRDGVGPYYSYYDGHFFEVNKTLEKFNFQAFGLTPERFNAIPYSSWEKFLALSESNPTETIQFTYRFDNRAIHTESASASLDVEHKVGSIYVTRLTGADSPTINVFNIQVEEYSIEGRLKEIERINAMHFLDLQFKTDSLIAATQMKLHNAEVNTFAKDTMIIKNQADSSVSLYDATLQQYKGKGILETNAIELESPIERVALNAIAENCAFKISSDNGVSWISIAVGEVKELANKGKSIIIQVELLNENSILKALGYMWV